MDIFKEKRVLWYINVFDRFEMLKQQQELIKREFGDSIKLLTFCNHANPSIREKARHIEDFFEELGVNSGKHSGVRDGHNSIVPYLDDFDIIISSHADCLFTDYSVVREIVQEMLNRNAKHCSLTDEKRPWTHTPQRVDYWTFADFFILTSDVWKKIGVWNDNCDASIGIEGMFYIKIMEVISIEEVYMLPVEHLSFSTHPHMFKNVLGKVNILRDNSMNHRLNYMQDRCVEYFEFLKKKGLSFR